VKSGAAQSHCSTACALLAPLSDFFREERTVSKTQNPTFIVDISCCDDKQSTEDKLMVSPADVFH
jgi:hypothetical protein